MPTLTRAPSPERRSSTRSAKARAFSSVGRKTTLRSFTFTTPGAPAVTLTPPKAFLTSSRGASPAASARSAVCSKAYEGP